MIVDTVVSETDQSRNFRHGFFIFRFKDKIDFYFSSSSNIISGNSLIIFDDEKCDVKKI